MRKQDWLTRLTWRGLTGMLGVIVLLGFLVNMNPSPAHAAPTPRNLYVDAKLGFTLQFPAVWTAAPHDGRQNTSDSDVIFTNAQLPGNVLDVGVMRNPLEPVYFAQRGVPSLSIGGYPAFKADTAAGKQVRVPCLGRVMLAHDDLVIATWCSQDEANHAAQLDAILATYSDHHQPGAQSTVLLAQTPVNPVLSCSQVIANPGPNMWGYLPSNYANDATFGSEQVYPTSATWTNNFGEGVAVCDDYYSQGGIMWENSYLFQCVELANRFINEEWGLKEFTVDAFAYYDNYQSGAFVQGQAVTFFGSQVQEVDDASQGNNSSLPQPGDLLVFQDVNDGAHWTSGEKCYSNCSYWDPGHVGVVTSATTSQVTIVQQNFNPSGAVWTLQVQHWSNGYHIVDNSGVSGRITRGWLHFFPANSASSHMVALSSNNTFVAIGNTLYKYDLGATGADMLSTSTNGVSGPHYIGNQTFSSPITAIAVNGQYPLCRVRRSSRGEDDAVRLRGQYVRAL